MSFYEAKEGGESRSGCGGGQSESRKEALGGEKCAMISHVAPGCGELYSGVVAGQARKLSFYEATERGRVKVWLRWRSVRVAEGSARRRKAGRPSHGGTEGR